MSKPIVAIVGRPNVGKSTLFNIFADSRISIVEDTPGVTRDRLYAEAEWLDRRFMMVDTGGIEIANTDSIAVSIREQAKIAIKEADVILFVCDARTGVTTEDQEVAKLIRMAQKPVVLAVNKADTPTQELEAYEFYNLGIGEPYMISASNRLNLGDLLDAVVSHFPDEDESDDDDHDDVIKVAIIGRPNVGKSSIFNDIIGQTRSIVSDVAGTTRDAIDVPVMKDGQTYLFIDTARGCAAKGKSMNRLKSTALSVPYVQWTVPMLSSWSSMPLMALPNRIKRLQAMPTRQARVLSLLSISGICIKRMRCQLFIIRKLFEKNSSSCLMPMSFMFRP